MFGHLAAAFEQVIASFQHNIHFAFLLLIILWGAQTINWISHYRLCVLGIYPRSVRGLTGIIFAPFLHRDFNHLFFNSIPLFILANLVLLHGRLNFYYTSLVIILVGGFLVWLCGKRAIHIGASGLIMGYFGYLIADAYYEFSVTTIILAALALYYFGGLALSLVPDSSRRDVSFSGHLFGFLAGVLAAYFFR